MTGSIKQADSLMAANAIPNPELHIQEIHKKKMASKSCVALKQRFEKLLRAVLEAREEYLGLTQD